MQSSVRTFIANPTGFSGKLCAVHFWHFVFSFVQPQTDPVPLLLCSAVFFCFALSIKTVHLMPWVPHRWLWLARQSNFFCSLRRGRESSYPRPRACRRFALLRQVRWDFPGKLFPWDCQPTPRIVFPSFTVLSFSHVASWNASFFVA